MDPKETPLKQIRTFQGDVAEALQRQQESLVSIQQREHLKNPGQSDIYGPSQNSGKRKQFFFLFLGSTALFALGAVGIWYSYNEFIRKTTAPAIATPANRFLSVGDEITLDLKTLSRATLIDTFASATEDIQPGELRHITLRQEKVDGEHTFVLTSELLEILESRAPGNLVRAFDPLFMLGTLGGNQATDRISNFLIIKLSSFENAFAGMLLWEKNMGEDIGPLFATATLLKNIPFDSTFTDVTDKNKDIRMLMLENQPVLLYSFFGNNMLIITDSLETLRTLIDRLTREKLSR